jgi:hypothetical protein
MDKQTMLKFDEACLTPVRPLTAAEIRALRVGRSQARLPEPFRTAFTLTEAGRSICSVIYPPVASVAGREAASGRLLHVRMEAAKMTREEVAKDGKVSHVR